MKKIDFSNVEITGGFWKTKQETVKNTTVKSVYERFCDTHRFDALKCDWKEGQPDMPHIFWDSDVAKWIEGVAYILKKERNQELEKIIDDAVDLIVQNSDENGYYNSHYLVTRQDERFCHRDDHELYCLGHLIEGAIAYYEATGKDKFLKAMCRYADYIERVFAVEKSAGYTTPGHPELELALVRLYEATGEERYFRLAEFFIDEHGKHENDLKTFHKHNFNDKYNQDDMPLKDKETAEGHCVRAMYLFCGAADVARIRGDKELFEACRRVFNNVVNKRMYITGGIGPTHIGEAFSIDYYLPNRTAYAETCASISLAMLAGRMLESEANSLYADIVEKEIYNGILSGVSMDGKAFFYENPLEIDLDFNEVNTSTNHKERYPITQRLEVFDCSCCPPNIVRFIPSVAQYMYTYDESTVYVHQYMDSKTDYKDIKIIQKTAYPENGKVRISFDIGKRKLALRIPGWCKSFSINCEYTLYNGYALVESDKEILIDFDMPAVAVRANRRVHENAGRVAIMRGPVVYCAEGVDNGNDLKNIRIDMNAGFETGDNEFLLPSLITDAYIDAPSDELYMTDNEESEKFSLKLIPYYAFANRGSSSMLVWILKK